MAIKKKGVNKKVFFAIILIALIVVGVVAAMTYSNRKNNLVLAKVGVSVGDYFTYSLSGLSNGPVPSTVSTDFSIYNDTSYYNVTVTAINGTKVTLETDWVLQNGTSIDSSQTIDLASGITTVEGGFYALYPANMNANETVYPHVYQDVWINGTQSTSYTGGARETNYYTATGLIYYTQDPTGSTQGSFYDQIYFDRSTGMLTGLIDITDYNNPELSTEIVWTLTSSNAWQV